jgi:hypothetical protein
VGVNELEGVVAMLGDMEGELEGVRDSELLSAPNQMKPTELATGSWSGMVLVAELVGVVVFVGVTEPVMDGVPKACPEAEDGVDPISNLTVVSTELAGNDFSS